MEVQIDKIAVQWRARVKELASLAGVTRKEIYSRMSPGDPQEIVWAWDCGHRVIDVSRSSGIPFDAMKRWQQEHAAPPDLPVDSPPGGRGQLNLEMPQTEGERAAAVLWQRLYRLNPTKCKAAVQRFALREDTGVIGNHKYAISKRNMTEAVKLAAIRARRSQATVYRWKNKFNSTLREKGIVAAIEALAEESKGPRPGTVLDESQQEIVTRLWLEGKTRKQCYEGMIAEEAEKAQALGPMWAYDSPRKPLYYSVMRFINAAPPRGLGGETNPKRRGREAVFNSAGYMDRRYDDEPAGYTWCIDEWELDGFFYLQDHHRTIVNPYLVSVIDERTTKILGWRLSKSLDAETVLDLMEELVREYGPPRFLVSDRLGHYRRMVEHKKFLARKSDLTDRLAGPLEFLGVTNRGPKREKNPRANRIERVHGIYSVKARRDFGPSWREPLEGKHKARRVDDNIKRHLREHCRLGTAPPQLLSFEDAEQIVADWVAEINAADTDANGCCGMSRQAAFLQFQPKEPRWRPEQAEVDAAFAQQTERTVRAGGVIEVDEGRRYSSPQLLARTGEKALVVRYRRDKSLLFVHLDESKEAIVAMLRPRVGTKDTDLRSKETAKLIEARAILAHEEVPLVAFEDAPEEEAERVRERLPRSLAEQHPGIERASHHEQEAERKGLPCFGDE